jgi:hypothetical protein
MSGAIPPLPNTPKWRGAYLKEKKEVQGQLYLYLSPETFGYTLIIHLELTKHAAEEYRLCPAVLLTITHIHIEFRSPSQCSFIKMNSRSLLKLRYEKSLLS